jgi:hypothetical protein
MMIEKQRNKTGEKGILKKEKGAHLPGRAAHACWAIVGRGSSSDLCPVQIENISGANHNFVKIRANHGKKIRLNFF